jgi:hypothetical protein
MLLRITLLSFILFITNLNGYSQTILYQDFEGGADSWGYTLNPSTYDISGDVWGVKTSLSSISPSSGTQFWGMQDLDNPNGGGNFDHTITFNAVNVSTYTGVTITFDYHTIGYDGTDEIQYQVFEDGIGQGVVNLNKSTGTMTTVTYNVPDAVNSVYIVLIAKQNGGSDYAGWDNVIISGTSSGGPTSHTVTFNGNGNDGGSMSDQTASSSTALTSNSYTQTGCTFTEWNTAANGSGTSYADGATYDFSADITLYAQWDCSSPSGGNCVEEDFDDYSDWTNSGTAEDNVASHYGIAGPCLALGSGDELISPSVDNPTQLQFYQDASGGGDGNTALVEYSLDGGTTWLTCYSFTVSTSGGTETIDLTNIGGVDLSAYTGVIFQFSSSFNTWYLDDVVVSCGSPATNTITTGAVSGSPFSIGCGTSDNGTVSFTSTDTFGVGNIYTAQLSDASGNFSFPINIGTLSSTANSGTINISVPAGTATGSGYKIRIISSNPYITGSESSTFTINLTDGPCAPPHITSVLFNGCDPAGCGGEGRSEIVFANTGANSVLVNSANLDLMYPPTSGYNLLQTIVSNSSIITTMNDSAACGTLFYDANGQTLPPNTTMLIVSSSICAEVNFDWSGLCGQGPIYVVFGQSGTSGDSWHDGGNFGNSSGTKDFDLDITTTDANTYSYTYTYVSSDQGDGEFATFSSTSPGGNATSVSILEDCKVTTEVLPIKLLHFKGKKVSHGNLLEWATTTEINNDYFTLERAEDGFNFTEIGIVNGAGNSSTNQYYQFTDDGVTNHINYYRLKQTDFNGQYSYSNIIAISENLADNIYYNNSSNQLIFSGIDKGLIVIYNTYGQLIKSIDANQSKATLNLAKGMYILTVQTANESFSKKIIIR